MWAKAAVEAVLEDMRCDGWEGEIPPLPPGARDPNSLKKRLAVRDLGDLHVRKGDVRGVVEVKRLTKKFADGESFGYPLAFIANVKSADSLTALWYVVVSADLACSAWIVGSVARKHAVVRAYDVPDNTGKMKRNEMIAGVSPHLAVFRPLKKRE